MAETIPTQPQKDMYNLMSTGKGFISPLTAGSSSVTGKLGNVTGHVSDLTGHLNGANGAILAGAGLTTNLLSSLSSSATAGANSIKTLTDYGTKATSEFSQRMRVADSYTKNVRKFTGKDLGCTAHAGVFGVVKDIGQQAMDAYDTVMDTMESAITALNDAINAGLNTIAQLAATVTSAINNAIQAALDFAKEITDAIAKEAEELAKQLADSAHAWLAGVLPDWFSDSCKAPLTNQVSTPELKAAATS